MFSFSSVDSLFSSESLRNVLRGVEQMAHGPGRSLARASAVVDGVLLALGVLLLSKGVTFFSVLVLVVGLFFGLSALVFFIRITRLESRVKEGLNDQTVIVTVEETLASTDYSETYRGTEPSPSRQVAMPADEARPRAGDPAGFRTARIDVDMRDTWMPRVDFFQRSVVAAAGGVVNVPYLRDDLRITLLSALVSAVSIPVGSFFAILALFALL